MYVRNTRWYVRLRSDLQTFTLRLVRQRRNKTCSVYISTVSWTLNYTLLNTDVFLHIVVLQTASQSHGLKTFSYCTCRLLSCRPGGWCGKLTLCVPAWFPLVSPFPPNSKLLSPVVRGVPLSCDVQRSGQILEKQEMYRLQLSKLFPGNANIATSRS